MKIQKLTLDNKEMVEAVQSFLKTRGISMPVHTVTRGYSWRDFEVTFDFEVDADAPSKLEPKESLPAIEPLPEVMSAETLAAAIAPTPTAPVEIPNA